MPKTKDQKTKDLKEVKENLENSQAVVFADYQGLSVNQTNELRSKLFEVGAKATVVKNSLITKANKNVELKGNTVVVYGFDKVVEPVKVIYDFIKQNNLPTVKAGLLNGELLTEEQVQALSTMPSIDELRAKLVGSLNAPLSGFVMVGSGAEASFARVLNAYKESKE